MVVLNQQVAEAVVDLVAVRRYILSLVIRLAAVVTQQREQYVHQMDENVVAVRYLLQGADLTDGLGQTQYRGALVVGQRTERRIMVADKVAMDGGVEYLLQELRRHSNDRDVEVTAGGQLLADMVG